MQKEQAGVPKVENLELRYTVMEDASHLREWLLEPGVLKGFPMADSAEVDDSVKHWISFSKYRCSLTAMMDGKPCGMATLCLMPYKKLAHQCLLSIIVGAGMRGKGVGTVLMNNILHLGRHYFKMEVIYLEVYEDNPAINLYKRFGFREVGFKKHFMKEEGLYLGQIVMERLL